MPATRTAASSVDAAAEADNRMGAMALEDVPASGIGGKRAASGNRKRRRFQTVQRSKPRRALARVALVLRAGAGQKSKRSGVLFAGSVVYVLEMKFNRDGIGRAHVALRDTAKGCGWVTATKNGDWFLDIEGGMSDAETAASVGPTAPGSSNAESVAADERGADRSSFDPSKVHLTIKDLEELLERQLASAASQEGLLMKEDALPARIGETLRVQKLSAAEYLRQWDLGAGVTKVKLYDFRRSVRMLIGSSDTSDSSEIDILFEALDLDKDGTLDTHELKVAFKGFKDAAVTAERAAAYHRERAERFHSHAQLSRKAIDATRIAEAMKAELRQQPSIEAKIGSRLVQKQVKVGDIVRQWDLNDDGVISEHEFCSNLEALGVDATKDELAEFFQRVDVDRLGYLEPAQCMRFLRTQQEAFTAARAEAKLREKQASELWRAARVAQVAAAREAHADEQEALRDEAEAAAAAQMQKDADAQAKAAAKLAKKGAKAASKNKGANAQQEKRPTAETAWAAVSTAPAAAPSIPPPSSLTPSNQSAAASEGDGREVR